MYTYELGTDRSQTGYISTPDTRYLKPLDPLDSSVVNLTVANNNTITWSVMKLDKGRTFRTYITGVKVHSTVGILEFRATQGAPLVPTTKFYVVALEDESVTFGSNVSSVSAASLQTVVFTFTAADTPIGGGKVQFSIPSGWTVPVKTKDDVLGAVTVGGTGDADHDTDLTVSGRSITVAVKSLARIGHGRRNLWW